MKVKEIAGTCHFAWSPTDHCLVTGTAAQQLDATFSTTAALELWQLDMSQPNLEAEKCASLTTEQRFHQMAWGKHGVIVAGTGGGTLLIYNPDRLKAGQSDALLAQHTHHTGPVRALDFNPFQPHLLASGAAESTILVWDLKTMGKPMAPGSTSLPAEEVTSVAWNHQVQYILASSFHSRCVVWDLRKNEPVIKVSDSSSHVRCKVVAWHPDVATQMCLASEDDHCPVVQLWDLRFATSPLKTQEQHQAGVLSIAWCPLDSDLLLSCGKDNQLLCWNPNANLPGGDILCSMPLDTQWNFSVQWSPRNPALLATSSFDGKLSVYSILGSPSTQASHLDISDSFPGTHLNTKLPVASSQSYLKKPPKWLNRTCGASFGFGGKLVLYGKTESSQVLISQVVTHPELISRAKKLESALNSGDLLNYCLNKLNDTSHPKLSLLWSFVKSSMDKDPRASKLALLGFDSSNLPNQISDLAISDGPQNKATDYPSKESMTTKKGNSTLIHALLTGNIDIAVNLCIQEGSWPEAFILAQAGGRELFCQTQENYLQISTSPYAQLLSAIVADDWDDLVTDVTAEGWRAVLGALLSYAPTTELSQLCDALGEQLSKLGLPLEALLCYICSGNAEKMSQSWKMALPEVGHEALAELVVVLRVLQQPLQSGPSLTSLLMAYLEGLCHQGALSLAAALVKYLEIPSLKKLHERILPALMPPKTHTHPTNNTNMHHISNSYKSPGYQNSYNQAVNSSYEPQPPSRPPSRPGSAIPPPSTYSPAYAPPPPKYGNLNSPYSPTYSQPAPSKPIYSPNYATPSIHAGLSSNTLSQPPSTYGTVPQNNITSPPSNFFNPYSSNPTGYGAQPSAQQGYGAHTQPPPISYINPATSPSSAYSPGISSAVPSSSGLGTPLNKYGMASPNNMMSPPPAGIMPPGNMPLQSANTLPPPPTGRMPLHSTGTLPPPPIGNMPMQSKNILQPQVGNMLLPPASTLPPPPPTSSMQSSMSSPLPGNMPLQPSSTMLPPPGSMLHPSTLPPPPLAGSMSSANPIGIQQASNIPRYAADTMHPPHMPTLPPNQPSPPPTPPPQAVKPGWNDPPPIQTTRIRSRSTSSVMPYPGSFYDPTEHRGQESGEPAEHPASPPMMAMNSQDQVIQKVLEALKEQCLRTTSNPQHCRKLEEVSRRLENLYEQLCYRSLPPPALEGLHQIVHSIQNSDFLQALNLHNQLVSGAHFSDISSFMPGIKVLLQTATILRLKYDG
ncbi:SEC31A [Cordylochernes scorpioides]|uniref:SEC31A n=1 Tax=Cordylochernes scorpioides TaxID=51811 RepID=A0ABY6K330_9ARAC|nr:SEC31A [Cordylochernes scorpioides]